MSYDTKPNLDNEPPHFRSKTDYFLSLAMRLFSRMKQDIKYGKLTRRDAEGKRLPANDRNGWINVVEHCLVQAAAAEALGKALGLDSVDIDKLVTVAAVHDWDKRIEIQPEKFTAEEIATAEEAFRKIKVSTELLEATSERSLVGDHITFLQKLQHYIDSITDESDFVAYEVRLDRAAARRGNPNDPFWDKEKEIARSEQKEIFDRLVKQGYQLSNPIELPAFIKAQIERNYQ